MGATSEHFSAEELACPHCGVNGATPELVAALEQFRAIIGQPVHIDSAYRCAEHNAAIGGKPHSQHLLGNAADIRVLGSSAADLERVAREVPAIKGIGRSTPPMMYLHVDVRETPAEWCYNSAGAEVPYVAA
jgi:uncharacterized protein YcbK (DUF882 family)